MNKPLYIRCLDEGHGPVSPLPYEEEGTTALMVNPKASTSVLLDSAMARIARIIDVTKPYLDIENEDIGITVDDTIRLLITICAMGEEVSRLLHVAAHHPNDAEAMRKSYRQTVEAAEALIEESKAYCESQDDPDGKKGPFIGAVLEMEGHIDAARSDFLGTAKDEGGKS